MPPKAPKGDTSSARDGAKKSKTQGMCHGCEDLFVLHRYADNDDEHTIAAMLTHDVCELPVRVLLDTGAVQGKYISPTVADWLRQRGAEPASEPSRKCSAFNQ